MKTTDYAKITLFFIISFLTLACNQENKIDTSNIRINLKIERFDQDLSKINPSNLNEKLPQLSEKYGSFYNDYFQKILNVGPTNNDDYKATVSQILEGKPFQDLQQETNQVYPDIDKIKPEITEAFKRIKYYYPEWKVPKIITYISGFQVQTPIGSGYVGIGLDMFLGKNSKFYPALVETIPRYISRRFTPENITPRVVEVITREDLFPELDNDKTLLAKMVYNGKLLYFMKQIQPETADSTIIGYSEKQMKWANDYESDCYAYFLDQDLLYETDYFKIQKYISEAPFTPGLGEKNESAPKLGLFIGWQIVNNYMKENPKIALKELMLERDAQKILKGSKYRPSNKQN
ncbi:gliding motility lipoprotein GldB [Pedobacter psychrophilus]|uniref:Gliding motility lipoprotein GldB n=1 Tax=Pedobacter psychrophilus TaxID=1826909 RepID=A0A179DHX5_9SPHI|nr:gliding motility lipoprotein GldB [Pedobacter psychrophilus]OAQ40494.1 gliding motility lipoprotein GldB [Pedobacter psychrophilus]